MSISPSCLRQATSLCTREAFCSVGKSDLLNIEAEKLTFSIGESRTMDGKQIGLISMCYRSIILLVKLEFDEEDILNYEKAYK